MICIIKSELEVIDLCLDIKGDEIGYNCKVGNNAEICKEMRKIFKEALYKHREELLLSGECVKVDFNKKSAE